MFLWAAREKLYKLDKRKETKLWDVSYLSQNNLERATPSFSREQIADDAFQVCGKREQAFIVLLKFLSNGTALLGIDVIARK